MTETKEDKPKEKKPRAKKIQAPVINAHDAARRQALGAAMFQALCAEIDDSPQITAVQKARFKAMQLAEPEQTDITINCLNLLRNDICRSLELGKMHQDAAERMKASLASIEEGLLEALDGNNGQPFKGTIGELKISGFGGALPLEGSAADACKDVHYGNVIDASTAFELGIPDEFLIQVKLDMVRLNKEAIKEALEAGQTFAFANLGKRGRKLGGPFIKVGIMKLNTIEGGEAEEITDGQ